MKLLLTIFFSLTIVAGNAQYYYLGTAQPMDDQCILLTPDEPYGEGIAYNTNTINLNNDFFIDFESVSG